ncbi:MAG: hypothetical protein AVDCRST_MAG27-2504, partial [uncultured Craurococcus sp.]
MAQRLRKPDREENRIAPARDGAVAGAGGGGGDPAGGSAVRDGNWAGGG